MGGCQSCEWWSNKNCYQINGDTFLLTIDDTKKLNIFIDDIKNNKLAKNTSIKTLEIMSNVNDDEQYGLLNNKWKLVTKIMFELPLIYQKVEDIEFKQIDSWYNFMMKHNNTNKEYLLHAAKYRTRTQNLFNITKEEKKDNDNIKDDGEDDNETEEIIDDELFEFLIWQTFGDWQIKTVNGRTILRIIKDGLEIQERAKGDAYYDILQNISSPTSEHNLNIKKINEAISTFVTIPKICSKTKFYIEDENFNMREVWRGQTTLKIVKHYIDTIYRDPTSWPILYKHYYYCDTTINTDKMILLLTEILVHSFPKVINFIDFRARNISNVVGWSNCFIKYNELTGNLEFRRDNAMFLDIKEFYSLRRARDNRSRGIMIIDEIVRTIQHEVLGHRMTKMEIPERVCALTLDAFESGFKIQSVLHGAPFQWKDSLQAPYTGLHVNLQIYIHERNVFKKYLIDYYTTDNKLCVAVYNAQIQSFNLSIDEEKKETQNTLKDIFRAKEYHVKNSKIWQLSDTKDYDESIIKNAKTTLSDQSHLWNKQILGYIDPFNVNSQFDVSSDGTNLGKYEQNDLIRLYDTYLLYKDNQYSYDELGIIKVDIDAMDDASVLIHGYPDDYVVVQINCGSKQIAKQVANKINYALCGVKKLY